MLTLIKRFIRPDGIFSFFSFFFLVSLTYVKFQATSFLLYSMCRNVAFRWTWTSHCYLFRISEKSSFEVRKEGRREYTWACFVRTVRCTFPEAVLRTLEFLIRESLTLWNSRCVRSALPVCPDENGHNSSTRNPRMRPPSIEKQIQSSAIELYRVSELQYVKKVRDNGLVAWRELF